MRYPGAMEKRNKGEKKSPEQLFLWLCMGLAVVSLCSIFYRLSNLQEGVFGLDYRWIWRECACSLRGIDVAAANASGEYIEGLGVLPQPLATMPYARIMGNLITPGFLSERAAQVYGILLYAVVMLLGWICLCNLFCKAFPRYKKLPEIRLLVLLPLLNMYLTDGVMFQNLGVFISFLLMCMVWLLARQEEKPSLVGDLLCGVLLAYSMLKPQMGGIFFITLLMEKKYRVLLSSCILLLLSWLGYLLMVGGNFISQFMEIFGRGAEEFYWYGLLDGLRGVGISDKAAMLLSMGLGILLVVLLTLGVKKTRYGNNPLLIYMIPAFFSTVWSYKSTSDLVILCWPTLLALIYPETRMQKKRWHYLLSAGYLIVMNVKVFSGILRRVFGYEWLLGTNLDAWVRTLCFIGMLLLIVRSESDVKKTVEKSVEKTE